MKTSKFERLASTVRSDPERSLRVDAYKAELERELTLTELRAARRRTQVQLARSLNTTQSGISRLEHQADLYVSTLRGYIEALGGRLEIHGVFPDSRVTITSFSGLSKSDDAENAPSHDRATRR